MKIPHSLGLLVLVFLALVIAGCTGSTTSKPEKEDSEVKKALAKLSPEDRRLAEAQRWCPKSGELLGSMEVPVKLKVQDEPVFLCCDGCREEALADPAKTLAKVKEYKEKAASLQK